MVLSQGPSRLERACLLINWPPHVQYSQRSWSAHLRDLLPLVVRDWRESASEATVRRVLRGITGARRARHVLELAVPPGHRPTHGLLDGHVGAKADSDSGPDTARRQPVHRVLRNKLSAVPRVGVHWWHRRRDV